MSQDPSGYGTNPQNPYGAPQPGPNPYDVLPQNPYGAPPPQENFGMPPPQNPYAPQPPQNPYTVPSGGYGYPLPGQGIPGYGYAIPGQGAPGYGYTQRLPLGVAFQQLFGQYQRMITQPSAATFAAEIPKAAWDIVWVQIFLLVGIDVIINLLRGPILVAANAMAGISTTTSIGATVASAVIQGFSEVFIVPAFFFAGAGIQYLLARAFNGEGTFLAQCYTALLFNVPISVIIGLLTLLLLFIPYVGSFFALGASLCVSIYSIVLNVFQLMAAHRLSGGKATAVILIPLGVLFLLALLCAITSFAFMMTIFQQMQNR